MSLAPILNLLTSLMTALLPLAPIIGALSVFYAGFLIVTHAHGKGREALLSAIFGIVVMLGSQTIAVSVHP
jgi:hypothetical protein